MRIFRDVACLLVATGSVALAAWQPVVATDPVDAAVPAGGIRRVDDRAPLLIDRAVLSAPLVKA